MKNIITIVALAALLPLEAVALSIGTPVQAQSLSQAQEGDYYAPKSTMVQQSTSQERKEVKEGDYYNPRTTVVQEPTAQQLQRTQHGDYYAPNK